MPDQTDLEKRLAAIDLQLQHQVFVQKVSTLVSVTVLAFSVYQLWSGRREPTLIIRELPSGC